jgi:hypothetical protein
VPAPRRTLGDDVLLVIGAFGLAGLALLLFGQAFVLPCDGEGVAHCGEAEAAVGIGFGVIATAGVTVVFAYGRLKDRRRRRLVMVAAVLVAFGSWVAVREIAQRPDELGLGGTSPAASVQPPLEP